VIGSEPVAVRGHRRAVNRVVNRPWRSVRTEILFALSQGCWATITQVVIEHSVILSVVRGLNPVPVKVTCVFTITLFGVATICGGVVVGTEALAATDGIIKARESTPRRPAAPTGWRLIISRPYPSHPPRGKWMST
jgi:hypothetical protein